MAASPVNFCAIENARVFGSGNRCLRGRLGISSSIAKANHSDKGIGVTAVFSSHGFLFIKSPCCVLA